MSIRSLLCRLGTLTVSAPATDGERGGARTWAASLWQAAQVIPPGAGDYLDQHRGAVVLLVVAAIVGALVAWYGGRR
jgi:hypothetical protein